MGQAKLKGRTREQRFETVLGANRAKRLSPERFNAFVTWTRSPVAPNVGEEVEHFASKDERVLGAVVRDLADGDFGYVVLGRDTKQRFRAIETVVSLAHREARAALLKRLKVHCEAGSTVFPQGDEEDDNVGVDLFSSIVPQSKLNPWFDLVRRGDHWLPARGIMSEMMRHFRDVDGNFVEQFQSTGFDARVWELYLYAALLELGLFVIKPKPAPDFQVSNGCEKVFIEAVTVNPSDGEPAARPRDKPVMHPPEDIRKLNETVIPIKFGSALWSKLMRKNPYWELPDVRGHPLVFAVADFHEKQSMTWTSSGLIRYLYGVSHSFRFDESGRLVIASERIEAHEHAGKRIPSGFFLQPQAENVSAVLFSASGTMSKFNRMGRLAGFGRADQLMMRTGLRHKHDENAALPERFCFEVAPGKVTETWAEGLSMFHNPQALHPVAPEMFPGIAHHFFGDGKIISLLPEFHPYSSYTWNILPVRDGSEARQAG